MKKQVTIYDIAKKAQTSTATVSRVLSKSGYPVKSELRERIQKIAEELNYIPNMIGRQLKTNTSITIGVIVPTITNPFYSSVVLGIEDIARERGYQVLLCNSHRSSEIEEEYLKTLLEKQVKGLIISSVSTDNDMLSKLVQMGLNVVAIDQSINELNTSQIHFDYRKGGFLATEFLIEKGHTKIAFISSPLSRPSRQHVYEGYRDALMKYGVKTNKSWICISSMEEEISEMNYEFNNGIMMARRLLSCSELPTAIFVCNDMTAFGVMNELTSHNIKIPEQTSIVGFDNIEFSKMVSPTLTTIQQPDYEMGRIACNTLLDQLDGGNSEYIDIILQPRIIERNSTMSIKPVLKNES